MELKVILMALIGGFAAILANRAVAVFNDGLRPLMWEMVDGSMDRRSLAATSFALSFGLVIGYGIPMSVAATIILIHSILLGTDIIGTWAPGGWRGTAVAGVAGALYGGAIAIGLSWLVSAFAQLPVDFLKPMGQVGAPIVAAFCTFPALTVGLQFGFKKGLGTFIFALLVRQAIQYYGIIMLGNGVKIQLNPEGMALLAGMIVLIFFATRERRTADSESVDLVSLFGERVARIRKNWPWLAVMGGLVAAATSAGALAGDPISLNLLSSGKVNEATLTAFARAIGFIPLITATAITTGVYSPVGITFVFVVGLAMWGNPVMAFVVGAVVITLEVFALAWLARFLDHFPGMRDCGDNIRTAMNKLLELALIVGGMMAAHTMAPNMGFFIVAGLYILNQVSKRPVTPMAIGPIGAIITGILCNVLYWMGLYLPK